MAYNAITFVAFEQPTTAKWNYIGSNDAGFRDGSNIQWNNNQAIQMLDSGAVARTAFKLTTADVLEIGDGANIEVGLKTLASARAYLGSNQSIANATEVLVELDTENYDTGSDFNVSSGNHKFVCPVSGKYLIVGNERMSLADQDLLYLEIFVNGSAVARTSAFMSGSGDLRVNCTDIEDLNANDYIQLYVYHTYGSARNLIAGTQETYLAVQLLSI